MGQNYSSGCRQEYKFFLEYFIELVFVVKSSVAVSHHSCLKCESAPSYFTQHCLHFIKDFQISNIYFTAMVIRKHCGSPHHHWKNWTVCSSELANEGMEESNFVNFTFLCSGRFAQKNFFFFFSPWIRCSTKLFHNFTKPDHRNALEWALATLVRQEGVFADCPSKSSLVWL